MDLALFLGRFHPLIVHLPIGILLLAYLLEWLYFLGVKKLESSRKMIIAIYLFGGIAGLFAAISGNLLATSDDYGIQALNTHKNVGIATLLALSVLLIIQWRLSESQKSIKLIASTMIIVLTALTGHFGGNLTHGPAYLVEYGPHFLQSDNSDEKKITPDSFLIFPLVIEPIIKEKCLACHNSNYAKGGLILDNFKNLFEEADNGFAIFPGNLSKSEFYNRVTLPREDEKAMPPRDPGLSYAEIQLLKYWILNNADSLLALDSELMSEELVDLVLRDYDLDYNPKPYFEKVVVDSLDASVFEALQSSGFRINYLGESNYLLDVQYNGNTLNSAGVNNLNIVSEHITFLKLSNAGIDDDLLKELAVMPHLTRLDLSRNNIDESVLSFLVNAPHLESVNLNETSVKLNTVEELLKKIKLKRIYLWNSSLTLEEITRLQQSFVDVEIISSFRFKEVEKPISVFEKELGSE